MQRWVPLAAVARPHGVRGELRLRLFNCDSDLLLTLDSLRVRLPDGSEREVRVQGARRANDAILMKLHSVDDRDRAEELRGAIVCVLRDEFPPLAGGEFYACDVEGARVVVRSGEGGGEGQGEEHEIGRVRTLRAYPTVDVLLVDPPDGGDPWEVPLVDAVVRSVDLDAGVVTLSTMDGVLKA